MGNYARYTGFGGSPAATGVTSLNSLTGGLTLVAGSGVSITPSGSNITIAATGSGGSVTTVSVVSANGLSGSVANATTTPAITLSTTITGLLQGNGTAISAYTGGNLTDVGTDGITITGGTGSVIGSGTSIAQHVADTTHNGYLSSTDWNTFNGKQAALTLGNITSSDITVTGGTGAVVGSGAGLTVIKGNLTEATSSVLTITGGTGAQLGSGTTIQVKQASTSVSGYLSNTDWNTFNGKQASGNYLTALTGDGTASGPGSAALTLATVNTNTGSWGSSTAIPSFTVNGKGLLTAAGTNAVIAPAGTLSGTTLNASVVTSSLTSVGTIGTGVWNGTAVVPQYGGTGLASLTAYSVLCGGTSSTGTLQQVSGVGTSGQILTSNGASALPTWQPNASAATGSYAQSYFGVASTNWKTTTTGSFVDPALNAGTATLSSTVSSNITLTAASGSLPGITFTPANSSAVYQITARTSITLSLASLYMSVRMTDGTIVVATSPAVSPGNVAADASPLSLTGIYAPATGSAVTVKLQIFLSAAGTATIGSQATFGNAIEWTVLRIA